MLHTNKPATIYKNAREAEADALLCGFDHGEFMVEVDPKGSGRAIVRLLDDDGFHYADLNIR